MIGISTVTSNTSVPLIIQEDRKTRQRTADARVNRYPTLSGGATVVHLGFAAADMTFRVYAERVSKADCDTLWTLFTTETQVLYFSEHGMYLGSIKNLKADNGSVDFTFYVKEEIAT